MYILMLLIVLACLLVCAAEPAHTLGRDGVAVLPGAISSALCVEVRREVAIALADPHKELGDIRNNTNRTDVHLPIEGACLEVLKRVWATHGDMFAAHLDDPDPVLTEFSCIISTPGCEPQEWHNDVYEYDPAEARMLTIGVALQDIDEDMGPTEIAPGTHRHSEAPPDLESRARRYACRMGDLVVWDSCAWHRGGPNVADSQRALLCMSLASSRAPLPKGSTYSLQQRYKGGAMKMSTVVTWG